jgi:hypothetical protein
MHVIDCDHHNVEVSSEGRSTCFDCGQETANHNVYYGNGEDDIRRWDTVENAYDSYTVPIPTVITTYKERVMKTQQEGYITAMAEKYNLTTRQVNHIRQVFHDGMTRKQAIEYFTRKIAQPLKGAKSKKAAEENGKDWDPSLYREQPREHFIGIVTWLSTADESAVLEINRNDATRKDLKHNVRQMLEAFRRMEDTERTYNTFVGQIVKMITKEQVSL